MKNFWELCEPELLALAISLEEEDARIYGEFAEGLQATYPDPARIFKAMADEETGHRHRLLDLVLGGLVVFATSIAIGSS